MTHVLIGKTINSLQIASDKMALKVETPEGDIVANTDGDCCSHSWIEHVELPALGFPAKVISAEEIEMPDCEQPEGDFDVITTYGFKIVTDRGEIIIDYRNSSNGYYGGWLSWPDDDSWNYGGVFGQNASTNVWTDITPA